MSEPTHADAAEIAARAIARARAAGAAACDVVLVASRSSEARVRDREIDFVKQARERGLGSRVLVREPKRGEGLSYA
ncbi:MAG: hypothetical protein KC560_01695, partial [Myxococcales bacterium]|nr:hypothetical protein [Myxococcales bacterium]